VKHYKLKVGLIQQGDPADCVVIDNLESFNIQQTYVNGIKVSENGQTLIESVPISLPNIFNANPLEEKDLEIKAEGDKMQVVKALDGQLITKKLSVVPKINYGLAFSDTDTDILKMVVLNRYKVSKPAIGFVNGFNLKKGAIASTVAHDSHNIIAVGTNDADLVNAINLLVDTKGGISLVDKEYKLFLALPVAGIMSEKNGHLIANKYKQLNQSAKELGSTLHAPYMTLSFMALLVIPELKLSDQGLFDGSSFEFTSLFIN
jgi:adenine deaminase